MEGRLALLEAQLLAAEQQREAANTQLLAAMQRADAAAADVARCARLQRQLQELEVGECLPCSGGLLPSLHAPLSSAQLPLLCRGGPHRHLSS
jgi:hypothetical protein